MTELSFLLDLLLNHKLPTATKVAVTERIREVESRLVQSPPSRVPPPSPGFIPPHLANQAPSTIAALARHTDLDASLEQATAPTINIVAQQPAIVAHNPATQAALNARQEAINLAVSGKPEKGRTSPRKF